MMNIFEALREDHDKQRRLLERLAETQGDSDERRDLFEELKVELQAHAAAEERAFYARLMADPLTTAKARHGVAEHEEMDDRLAELDDTAFDSPGWIVKFRQLKDRVEHHLEEEEREVFQMGGKVLSDDEKSSLAAEYQEDMAAETY